MLIYFWATAALANPEVSPRSEPARERVLVVGSVARGPEPGWVAGLGDCLQEARPGRFQVLDRRAKTTTFATLPSMLEKLEKPEGSRIVVALPADPEPDLDPTALEAALGKLAGVAEIWMVVALPVLPDRRGSAYQELSGLAAKKSTLRLVDPWGDIAKTQLEASSSSWLSGSELTAAGNVRVASITCDAVLPRTP